MLYSEFVERVGINVDAFEWKVVNEMYNMADVDKDEFCKLWVKMNAKRVERIKKERREAEIIEENRQKAFVLAKKYERKSLMSETCFNLAVSILTAKEIQFATEIGIKMEGKNTIGVPYFKSIQEIQYEFGKFAGMYE